MTSEASEPRAFQFDSYTVDLQSGELRKGDRLVKLQPQPFKVLALLASRSGQLVTREEVQKELWTEDTFVDFEHGINYCIKEIRTALGDHPEKPRYIQTLPRRGYRFTASVEVVRGETADQSSQYGWLRNLLIASGVVGVLALALGLNVFGLRDKLLGEPIPSPIDSLAVLPLENLSGDPEQEYFVDGMTDALIAELGQIGTLKVISRTSVYQFKDTDKSLSEIAKALNVDGIVEGSVLRVEGRVRVTVQLIHAATDRQMWADGYERNLGDILALQGEVARAVAREILVELTPQEQARLATTYQVNSEAHEAYLKGRYFFHKATPSAAFAIAALYPAFS